MANCLSLPKADSFWGVDLIVFILFSISILEARTLDFLDWIWQFYANLHFSHAEQMHKPPFLISSYIYCQFNIAKPPFFLQVKPPLMQLKPPSLSRLLVDAPILSRWSHDIVSPRRRNGSKRRRWLPRRRCRCRCRHCCRPPWALLGCGDVHRMYGTSRFKDQRNKAHVTHQPGDVHISLCLIFRYLSMSV